MLLNEEIMYGVLAAIACVIGYWSISKSNKSKDKKHGKPFKTSKNLCLKDRIVIDMLNMNSSSCCFVLSDPKLPDNPLVFASDAFCSFTGYQQHEIINRNCRFLQGKETDKEETKKIGIAIKEMSEANICLTNYKKNGDIFINQFFLCPIFDMEKKLAYYLGVQVEVDKLSPGQQTENPGWVFTMGNHE